MTKNKIAIITGFNGQDGFYLNKLLIKKNYRIFGLVRKKNKNLKGKNIIKTDYSFDHIFKIVTNCP